MGLTLHSQRYPKTTSKQKMHPLPKPDVMSGWEGYTKGSQKSLCK